MYMALSRRLLECSCNMATGLLQKKNNSRAQGKRFNAFYGLTSEVTYCLFQTILLVMWFSSGSLCEGTNQGHERQK